MSNYLKIGEQTITSEELLPLLRQYQLLPQLIQEIIIDQEIAPIELTSEEEQIAYNQLKRKYQLSTDLELKNWLQQQNMTENQFQELAKRLFKIEKYKQDNWNAQIESYFLKRKAALDKVIYSLIRVKDPGIAQELYFRIQENEQSFSELSQQYSQGIEAETGGLLGPVELSVPHPLIAQLLRSIKPGELLPPRSIEQWWIILRLEKFEGAQLDEAMRQKLLNELFLTSLREKVNQTLSNLAII